MPSTKRCALYLRVSTDRQTVENQAEDVRRMVVARGFEPVVYEEVESAAKARPVLERLMTDARTGKIQGVAFWAIDRLQRSMVDSIAMVLELDRVGVPVMSVKEGWLDTASPARPLLVAVFGWVAQVERERLRERTVCGLQRARKEGKTLGRPKTSIVLLKGAQALVEGGASVASAAKTKGVSRSALRRHLAEVAENGTSSAVENGPDLAATGLPN